MPQSTRNGVNVGLEIVNLDIEKMNDHILRSRFYEAWEMLDPPSATLDQLRNDRMQLLRWIEPENITLMRDFAGERN